jgi:hypothetical protein
MICSAALLYLELTAGSFLFKSILGMIIKITFLNGAAKLVLILPSS